MTSRENLRQRILASLLPIACASFTAYLGYHGIYGDRGLLSLMHLNQSIDTASYELSQLRKERALLERRTRLLRADSLDPDLLDERARALLGYSEADEVVIFDPQDLVPGNN